MDQIIHWVNRLNYKKMLKLLIFVSAFVFVHSGSSPHGESYLKSLSSRQINELPRDIIEDSLLDAVSIHTL